MEIKRKDKEKFQCARCGFNKAECLEYVDHELLCQNCIYLKQTEKDRDVQNLQDLIETKIDDEDIEEEYGSFMKAPKGFTLEITNEDILIPKLA